MKTTETLSTTTTTTTSSSTNYENVDTTEQSLSSGTDYDLNTATRLFQAMDTDSNGRIDWSEFLIQHVQCVHIIISLVFPSPSFKPNYLPTFDIKDEPAVTTSVAMVLYSFGPATNPKNVTGFDMLKRRTKKKN